MKHTPGPWERNRDPRVDNTVEILDKYGWVIAEIYPGHDLDEFEGNTALIAAAPDLLEALKPFARMCNTNFVGTVYEDKDDHEVVLIHHQTQSVITMGDFRKASAALAKAGVDV